MLMPQFRSSVRLTLLALAVGLLLSGGQTTGQVDSRGGTESGVPPKLPAIRISSRFVDELVLSRLRARPSPLSLMAQAAWPVFRPRLPGGVYLDLPGLPVLIAPPPPASSHEVVIILDPGPAFVSPSGTSGQWDNLISDVSQQVTAIGPPATVRLMVLHECGGTGDDPILLNPQLRWLQSQGVVLESHRTLRNALNSVADRTSPRRKILRCCVAGIFSESTLVELRESADQLRAIADAGPIDFVIIQPAAAANTFVRNLRIDREGHTDGFPQWECEVGNLSIEALTATLRVASADDGPLDAVAVTVPAGESLKVAGILGHELSSGDILSVELLHTDALPEDNICYAAVPRPRRVLVIEDSTADVERRHLLRLAIDAFSEGRLFDVLHATDATLSPLDFVQLDAAVLLSPGTVSLDQVGLLRGHVAAGRGLLVVPDLDHPAPLRPMAGRKPDSLLRVDLDDSVPPVTVSRHIVPQLRTSDPERLRTRCQNLNLFAASFTRTLAVTISDDSSLVPALLLNDGSPLILESRDSNCRVALALTDFAGKSTTLPATTEFIPLVHQLLDYLTDREASSPLLAGDTLPIPPPVDGRPVVSVVTPEGNCVPVGLENSGADSRDPHTSLVARTAGVYRLLSEQHGALLTETLLVVNPVVHDIVPAANVDSRLESLLLDLDIFVSVEHVAY
jgi:hypothetical protein